MATQPRLNPPAPAVDKELTRIRLFHGIPMPKFKTLNGISLKIRAEDAFLIARIHIEGSEPIELARVLLAAIRRPGSDQHHAWVYVVSALFKDFLETRANVEISRVVRRRPKHGDQ